MSVGNEDTYKEMMRIRRTVESKFSILPPTLEKVEMKLEQEEKQQQKIETVSSKYDKALQHTNAQIEENKSFN